MPIASWDLSADKGLEVPQLVSIRKPYVRDGARLCENSEVELARRKLVSITLNKKRTALAVRRRKKKRENTILRNL